MDVSFILSADELFTLLSLYPEQSKAGRSFADAALQDAALCDLSGLTEKNLARLAGGELDLAPVIGMVADAIAHADSAEERDGVWNVSAPDIILRCEKYAYREETWKITPGAVNSASSHDSRLPVTDGPDNEANF